MTTQKGPLDGTWKVKGKTGILRALVGDVKHIKGNRGYNVWMKWFKWGHFTVVKMGPKSTWDFLLLYDKGKITDYIRKETDGGRTYYSGEFYKHGNYIGNFTMEKISREGRRE